MHFLECECTCRDRSWLLPRATLLSPLTPIEVLACGSIASEMPVRFDLSQQVKTERDVTEVFRSTLLDSLREAYGGAYTESDITREQLLCVPPSDVVYRASIASTINYTVDQLLDFIEGWVEKAPELPMKQPGRHPVALDSRCPVRIALRSESVCQTEVDVKPCDCDEETKTPIAFIDDSSSDSEPCVAVGVLAVSLVAELLLFLVLLMIGVIGALWWNRRATK